MQHLNVFYVVDAMLLVDGVTDGCTIINACQYLVESNQGLLRGFVF